MFFQVNTVFSPHPRPSRSRPNSDPNHANIVNWDTYLRWRAPAIAASTQPDPGHGEPAQNTASCARWSSDTRSKQAIVNAIDRIYCVTMPLGSKSSTTTRQSTHHSAPGERAGRRRRVLRISDSPNAFQPPAGVRAVAMTPDGSAASAEDPTRRVGAG